MTNRARGGRSVLLRLARAACWAALAAASTATVAAPFAISYAGTITDSSFSEIFDEQWYTITLIVDNGGTLAANQTWDASSLRCIIWQMNTAQNVTYTENLAAPTTAALFVSGSLTTDGSGSLTGIFSDIVRDSGAAPGTYAATGFSPQPGILWYLNDANGVFFDASREFSDAAGGVVMEIAAWSAPVSVTGDRCAGLNGAPVIPRAQPVPTLGEHAMALLVALMGLAAWSRMRRSRKTA